MWLVWRHVVVSWNVSAEAKKNPILKRKKEKLPMDIIPPSEEITLGKGEQVVAVVMDVTHPKTAEPEAEIRPSAEALNATQGLCIQRQHIVTHTATRATQRIKCSYESFPSYVYRSRVWASACKVCQDQRRRACCDSCIQVSVCSVSTGEGFLYCILKLMKYTFMCLLLVYILVLVL